MTSSVLDLPSDVLRRILEKAPAVARLACRAFKNARDPALLVPADEATRLVTDRVCECSWPRRHRIFRLDFGGFPELVEAVAYHAQPDILVVGVGFPRRVFEPYDMFPTPMCASIRVHAQGPSGMDDLWVAADYSKMLDHVILPLYDYDRWCTRASYDMLKQIRCILLCTMHVARACYDVPPASFLKTPVILQIHAAYDRKSQEPIGYPGSVAVFVYSVHEVLTLL
jgi:hypothetical protein